MKQIDEVAAVFFFLQDWSDRFDDSWLEWCKSNGVDAYDYPTFEDARNAYAQHITASGCSSWVAGECSIAGCHGSCQAAELRNQAQQWLDDYDGNRRLFRLPWSDVTPSKWEYREVTRGIDICDADNKRIAIVLSGEDEEEDKEHAQLISSAPLLLEACLAAYSEASEEHLRIALRTAIVSSGYKGEL